MDQKKILIIDYQTNYLSFFCKDYDKIQNNENNKTNNITYKKIYKKKDDNIYDLIVYFGEYDIHLKKKKMKSKNILYI